MHFCKLDATDLKKIPPERQTILLGDPERSLLNRVKGVNRNLILRRSNIWRREGLIPPAQEKEKEVNKDELTCNFLDSPLLSLKARLAMLEDIVMAHNTLTNSESRTLRKINSPLNSPPLSPELNLEKGRNPKSLAERLGVKLEQEKEILKEAMMKEKWKGNEIRESLISIPITMKDCGMLPKKSNVGSDVVNGSERMCSPSSEKEKGEITDLQKACDVLETSLNTLTAISMLPNNGCELL